jgi:hypothetical protein
MNMSIGQNYATQQQINLVFDTLKFQLAKYEFGFFDIYVKLHLIRMKTIFSQFVFWFCRKFS